MNSSHPDLAAHIDDANGYNFVDENRNFQDNHGHGSHVAGTIGAVGNNNLGVTGVMWQTQILPVKVLSDNGSGSLWGVSQGILYAAGLLDDPQNPEPADVINMSLGSSQSSSLLEDAVIAAHDEGVLIVAAAGNDDSSSLAYPARYSQVISVGAVDYNYPNTPKRAFYSNYGENLDVVAPGGNTRVDTDNNGYNDGVLSTVTDQNYAYYQGTSMAAPHVSGLAGLMIAAGVPSAEIREVLRQTSMALGEQDFDPEYGYGLVNAYWAVNQVEEIRVLVGTRDGQTINAVAETSIAPKGGNFYLHQIPSGEYKVFAWVDVRKNNTIEEGDYFWESEPISFQPSQDYQVEGVIKELIDRY